MLPRRHRETTHQWSPPEIAQSETHIKRRAVTWTDFRSADNSPRESGRRSSAEVIVDPRSAASDRQL
jgi:hypothetical protein